MIFIVIPVSTSRRNIFFTTSTILIVCVSLTNSILSDVMVGKTFLDLSTQISLKSRSRNISPLLYRCSCYYLGNMIDVKATDERLMKPSRIILFFRYLEEGDYKI